MGDEMNEHQFQAAAAKNPNIKRAVVRSIEDITPNMRRVVFGGEDLADFQSGAEGGYIKLLFLDHPNTELGSPVMRTYSIRAHDQDRGELHVDFALHADTGGIAMDWVVDAKPGDQIALTGPGKVKMVPPGSDWYLIAADMTGQPAAICNIERLPADARGYVVLEVPSDADKQDIPVPEGVELTWVVNPVPAETPGALLAAIKALDWMEGSPFVWTACEFDTMRALRSYYRTDRAVERTQFYLSSYWRIGRSEDQHKIDKRKDADTNAPLIETAAKGDVRTAS